MHLFPNLIVLQLMISKLSSGLPAESRWSELSQNIKIIQMLGEEINCFCQKTPLGSTWEAKQALYPPQV